MKEELRESVSSERLIDCFLIECLRKIVLEGQSNMF
jgi:hypothetical protein